MAGSCSGVRSDGPIQRKPTSRAAQVRRRLLTSSPGVSYQDLRPFRRGTVHGDDSGIDQARTRREEVHVGSDAPELPREWGSTTSRWRSSGSRQFTRQSWDMLRKNRCSGAAIHDPPLSMLIHRPLQRLEGDVQSSEVRNVLAEGELSVDELLRNAS